MQKPIEYAQTLYTLHGSNALKVLLSAGKQGEWVVGMSASWLADVIRILVANETTPILHV